MTLSTVNIDTLIEQTTDKYISNSGYAALRNSCLLLSPVPEITSEINTELTRLLDIDKQTSATQLILTANKEQIQLDFNEKKQDVLEEQNDFKQSAQLTSELSSIQYQRGMNVSSMQIDETNIIRLQFLIKEIEIKIAAASHQHTHGHQDPEHTHGHPLTTEQQKPTVHGHPDPITHPSSSHQHGHSDSTPLELEKQRLSSELSALRASLSRKQFTLQNQLARIDEINKALTIDLPNKERQRKERVLAREERERARLTDDLSHMQLSLKNRRLLQQSISNEYERLQLKKDKLMQKCNDSSHQKYLARLETLLPSLSNLNFPEKEALKQIIKLLQDHLLTKAEEQKVSASRTVAYSENQKLIQELRQKESKIEQLKKSNPDLKSQNLKLENENQQLEPIIEARSKHRNNLLKVALFSLLLTGLAVGGPFFLPYMIPFMTITPLFFIPAVVVGLVSLSLLITTLVYTIKNSIDSNQLNYNKSTITDNLATISQQNSEIISLEQEIVPALKIKIDNSNEQIRTLDKRVEVLHQQAELLLSNAKKVSVASPGNQAFFDNPPPYTAQFVEQSVTKLSAPPIDEVEKSTLSCH